MTEMHRLVNNARIGYSFDQEFYIDDAVFIADMDQIISRKWLVAGHVSRIPKRYDHFLYNIGSEQITIIRENNMAIRAFFNDSLFACHVRIFHGLIFINMSENEPDDFDATFGDMGPILDYHGIANARIAHSGNYPTTANWKLVIENFFECYHCIPSHPEFCSIHSLESIIAVGAGPSSGPVDAIASFAPMLKAWEDSAAALGRPIGNIDDGPDSSHLRLMMQRMNKEGWSSETQDGTAPSPLMGKRSQADGGRMHLSFSPFTQIVADDHFAILFIFTPRSALASDVEMIWLVDGQANDDQVDIEKMIWGYHATTTQDKVITENNQTGIMSRRYRPGRYSEQEGSVIKFQKWYLNQFGRESFC